MPHLTSWVMRNDITVCEVVVTPLSSQCKEEKGILLRKLEEKIESGMEKSLVDIHYFPSQ
jgi:hypothetical protein